LVKGGIEVTTGPLGQGLANAVGLAIGEAHLAALYNKPGLNIVDHYTYVFCGDGCLEEGVTAEAASLAGHLGLGKLIVFYDDNHVTIDGHTELAFTEDVSKRFEAYGWHTVHVAKGDSDLKGIAAALEEAQRVKDKPSLIKVTTTIGFGSSKQGTEKVHGSPLGEEEVANVKKKFGFDPTKTFFIDDSVKDVYSKQKERGSALEAQWNKLFEQYASQHPTEAAEFKRRSAGQLPADWKKVLPTYTEKDAAKATRQFSQTVINALGKATPELVGGSADLNPSTLSYLDMSKDFQKSTPEGRNIRFGVREHGMAAIANGLAAYGGFIPYSATFFNFIGYAMGAVRLSAISDFGVIYVMTHDSIGLGEDGPTHQPIESLMLLRALPNTLMLRPADGNETSGAYAVAIENRATPSIIALSRQAVPNLKGTSIEGVYKGAYVVNDVSNPQIILVGTGSELSVAAGAAELLAKEGVQARLVSMPSWELFRSQSHEYQKSVFLDGVPVLAVEAGSAVGWREFAHDAVAMESFGASGPYKEVYKKFGITPENVTARAKNLLAFFGGKPAPSLVVRPHYYNLLAGVHH
jgi:transketolase